MSNFSQLSIDISKEISKETKKKEGIFFTPPVIIKQIIDYIYQYCLDQNIVINTVLEPSCGTCEFITYIKNKNDEHNSDHNGDHNVNESNPFQIKRIIGVELNQKIYKKIKHFSLKKYSKKIKMY